MKTGLKILTVAILATFSSEIRAQNVMHYGATALGQVSSGEFAPYFIGSLNGGRTPRKNAALLDFGASVDIDRSKRFSWGAGVEVITGYSSANTYARWYEETDTWGAVSNRPAAIWIQQLYGEIKFRGVFLRAGQKDHTSALLDESLSSGDLTRSSNARGIPGVEAGFIDFQDIPFTNGWVQIDGVIEYGRFTDDGFGHDQFNYYNYVWTKDLNYTYKRCFFRTKPSQPFSVTVGMQTAGQFGGYWRHYYMGKVINSESRGFHIKDVINMFFPMQGGSKDGYYEGNSLGTWDFKARYRLDSDHELSFAFQWPWEDGSGIGHRNGWDGLYGLYYTTKSRKPVTGAAIEYIDFRNQSGPIHWAPSSFPGSNLEAEATGGDDNYNNEAYGGYANYGMAIATPFLVSPLYNLNGFSGFAHNRAHGIHAAVKGCIGDTWDYTLKYSWQKSWGTGRIPSTSSFDDHSVMASAVWQATQLLPGLNISATVAYDHGSLRGNNFGLLVGISYSGNFTFNKNKK